MHTRLYATNPGSTISRGSNGRIIALNDSWGVTAYADLESNVPVVVPHGPSNYFVLEETNGVVAYATGGTDPRAQRSLISDLLLQTEIAYSSTVGGELLSPDGRWLMHLEKVSVNGLSDIGWFRSAVPFAPARARSILELTVTGGVVPTDASAVVLNVTVTGTQQPGFVTVWPCGSPMPTASNLNFATQDTVPNAVIVKVGTEGRVCFYSDAATHLIVDRSGFFPADSSYKPLVPARLLDSRGLGTIDGRDAGIGLRPEDSVTELLVAGRGKVPIDADAVVLNVTATGTKRPGFVTVWPCGSPMPNASNLNFGTDDTVPNTVIVKVGTAGKVCLYTDAATHLLADASGYFPAGSGYGALVPARLMDTRGPGTVDGQAAGIGLQTWDSKTELVVAGRGGVPSDAAAVVLNVTATGTQGPGYVAAWPCGGYQGSSSVLNYRTDDTVANAAIVSVGERGRVCLYTWTGTHLIADVNGYFPAGSLYSPLMPTRILDTRNFCEPTTCIFSPFI
jgi:hypothetical protein